MRKLTFSQWLFGGIDNPFKAGQWGVLHIATLVVCVALVLSFSFLVKRAGEPERVKRGIFFSLVGGIAFFEIMIRFVYCMKLFYFQMPEMEGLTLLWIILPKPWCAIACWSLIACPFVKKQFFYDFASLSALLCSFIFFIYPGVGYNNEHLLFENWYSILTHALLLTTSITMMTLGIAKFRFCHIWKTGICFALTFVYGLVEIYFLKIQADPMYFMPGGDIQAGILRMDYGLYLTLYIIIFLVYVTAAHAIGDKENTKAFFASLQKPKQEV